MGLLSLSLSVTTHGSLLQRSFPKPPSSSSPSPPPFVLKLNSMGRRNNSMVVKMSYEAGIGVMGTKLGMMTFIEPEGKVVPVTIVGFREGNVVTQIKTAATDGYDSVQVAYRRVRQSKLTKPEMGHLQKAGAVAMRHLQEFRLQSIEGFEAGQKLQIDEIFKEGDLVDVTGKSIGKGFQGINY